MKRKLFIAFMIVFTILLAINLFLTDYVVGTLAYETKEEVMEWMLDIQLGRRNLSPIQRIAIAEKYRSIYEKQARENQSKAGQNYGIGNEKLSQNSSKAIPPETKIDVRAKLSETAGVSTDTYSKGKKILDSDNEEVKEKVLSGEMSINAGYKELVGRRQQTRVQQLREGEAIHEVEAWKAKQRQATSTGGVNPSLRNSGPQADNEEKGQTRDIVAKIISWGTGTKSSGKDYSLGRSAHITFYITINPSHTKERR